MGRLKSTDRVEVRRKLLESAAREFAAAGYETANINRISVQAGFARGTIYNYFPSKHELFAAVLEQACERAADEYERALLELSEAAGSPSLREMLVQVGRADVAMTGRDEAFAQVLIRESMAFRSETYQLIQNGLRSMLAPILPALSAASASGALRSDRTGEELGLFYFGIMGLLYVRHWGSGGRSPDAKLLPELAADLFLNGVRPE